MTLAARIAHNSIISTITRVLSLAISLVTIGLITRYLEPAGFGNYTTISAFYFLIVALSDFGINQIFTREISRPKANEADILANVLGLRVVSVSITAVFGLLGFFFLPYSDEIKNGISLMFLALFFSSGSQTLNSVFQKRLVMHRLAYRELIGRLIQLLVVFITVKADLGLNGVLSAMIASFFFIFLAVLRLTKEYVPLGIKFDKKYWIFFLKESAPLGIAAFVNFLYFKADAILLSLYRSSHEVGIYGASYKVLESLIYFPSMFMGLIMPVFAYNIFHRPKKFLMLASKTLKAIWLATIPLTVFMFFLSEEAIRIIAGKDFIEASKVLKILSFALGAIFLAQFFNSILITVNHQKTLLKILSVTAGLSVILNLIFIPIYSYMGVAVISTFCQILVTIIAYKISRRWGVGWGEGWRKLPTRSFFISAVGMILILYGLEQIELEQFSASIINGIVSLFGVLSVEILTAGPTENLIMFVNIVIKGVLGFAVYAGLIFLTGGLTIKELSQIIFIRKLRENDKFSLPN